MTILCTQAPRFTWSFKCVCTKIVFLDLISSTFWLLQAFFLYAFEKTQPWKKLKKCGPRKKLSQILSQNSTLCRFFFTKKLQKRLPVWKKLIFLLPKLNFFPWKLNAPQAAGLKLPAKKCTKKCLSCFTLKQI